MGALQADLKFAFRTLSRSPLFTGIAILSLALGVGANTAIFTILDQLMLRLLPVKDPGTLVMLYQEAANNGNNVGQWMHSYPLYQDFQQRAAPLAEVFCRRQGDASITVDNQTERVDIEMVSGNYFSALGVGAAVGRVFNSREDDQIYNGHPVVVLSHDYWATRFAGDPKIVGKKIWVNNYPMTIVGVSAAGFGGLDPARSPQIRVPILMKPAILPVWTWLEVGDRRTRWVQVFARLKPGYTVKSAQAALQVLFTQIRQYEMTLPAAKDWSQYSRDQFMKGTIHVEKAAAGWSQTRNSFSTALIVLMCMVGLVLLIACANVANLLIARAVARQKEIAVRLSVGASRGQLVRQLLVESLLLSFLGGACGALLAVWLTRGLLSFVQPDGTTLLISPEPDWRILLFSLSLSLLTGLIFGLVPALKGTRPDLWATLKDTVGSVAGAGGSVILRKGLVSAQVALSFLLLFGAGLFVRSLQNLKSTETGFREIDNLMTFSLSPAFNGYSTERTVQFYGDLLGDIRALPGVKSSGFASMAMLSNSDWSSTFKVEGHEFKDGENMDAYMNSISPGYFQTMGVPLLEGRDFDRRDYVRDSKVCIVNRKFAEHFFGKKSAVGRHVGRGGPKARLEIEIIGVVENSLYEGPRQEIHREVLIPNYGNGGVTFYVRTAQDSNAMFPVLRNEVRKLAPTMPVYGMRTLQAELDRTLTIERLIATLSLSFGALATLLASVGLYGVMAFVVTRRTKEIGVRMALGAKAGSVIWIVMKEVFTLLAIGLVVGVPAAILLGRFVSAQLYGVKAQDPSVAGVSVILLLFVACLAGFIPARRASRIDPLLALRYE